MDHLLHHKSYGTAALDDFSNVKSSTASRSIRCGVIFSSLKMAKTHKIWGSKDKYYSLKNVSFLRLKWFIPTQNPNLYVFRLILQKRI